MTQKPKQKVRPKIENLDLEDKKVSPVLLVDDIAPNPAAQTTQLSGRSPLERLEIQKFARRLNDLMTQAGMNQSALATAVFGTAKDKRGFTVAKGRDRISNYLRGRDIPRPANLSKLARVFGLSVNELAPELVRSSLDTDEPAVSMRMVAGRSDQTHLVVNTIVDLVTAAQIISLLSKVKEDARQ